jgi:predicted dehydrogenase
MAKLKIGVFGAARGMTMIRVLLRHPDAEVVAICDKYRPLLDKAAKAAEDAGISVALYEDFEDFFRHDMDAVVLANYATEHAPFAVRLLDSGRHILSEVLPCETMAQAVELIEAVERSGKVYAYAENYCYMNHAFEMWRRYEQGDVGEVMYAEGEYIHDCSSIWPQITYGERDHWRNRLYSTFYCTHAIGPMMTITGRRPKQVVGFETQINKLKYPIGTWKGGTCGSVIMITMDNGAIFKAAQGDLKREPSSINYQVYGTRGCMESNRLPGKVLNVYIEGERQCHGTTELYDPEKFVSPEMAKKFSTHNGSDFYATHFFIEKILGREDGEKYSIDVYQAVDMGICGILAYKSILAGNQPIAVPDLRDPAQRDAYRNDRFSTDVRVAGDQVVPTYHTGNVDVPDEVYDHIRTLWQEGKRAE